MHPYKPTAWFVYIEFKIPISSIWLTRQNRNLYLFIKALQHKCWRSVGHQILQPVKDVEFRTVCLKSCRQEKKSMMHQDSLEPAAIRFTLGCLQGSAGWSEPFLPPFFVHLKFDVHKSSRYWCIKQYHESPSLSFLGQVVSFTIKSSIPILLA